MVEGIRGRAAFAGFSRGAPRGRSGPLTVIRNASTVVDSVQVAFAIPRRTGPAVVRNRLRRQLRAVLDDLVRLAQVPPGAYLVVVGQGARGADYRTLRSWMVGALEKLISSQQAHHLE